MIELQLPQTQNLYGPLVCVDTPFFIFSPSLLSYLPSLSPPVSSIMSSEEVAVGLPSSFSKYPGDMDALQEELERLNKEIIEANEDRAKAAEYGIVLLEQKQALQCQNEELNSLYDTTRRELETAVDVSVEVVSVVL